MTQLNVGIIGSGFVAEIHAESFKRFIHNARLAAVASPTGDHAAQFAARHGIPTSYTDYHDLLALPEVDMVLLCLPNYLHAEACCAAARAKKHIVCEKPLCTTLAEADLMIETCKAEGVKLMYAEELCFTPKYVRAKQLCDSGALGKLFRIKQCEKHDGPHMPWFWEGSLQGGGVLNDMMCHSVEVARFLLTPPGADRSVLTPTKVTAYASCLKWQDPRYAKILWDQSGGKTDYLKRPAEDFARSLIEYRDEKGNPIVVETTTSWCYVGAGLRLSMELLGPEYALQINTLDADLKVFFSRKVKGKAGEDLVEKQNAEVGLMPVVSDEEGAYGYTAEDRHMVRSFLEGVRPSENFSDGVNVAELLMTAYMSVEKDRSLPFPPPGLANYIPAVARGTWNPKKP